MIVPMLIWWERRLSAGCRTGSDRTAVGKSVVKTSKLCLPFSAEEMERCLDFCSPSPTASSCSQRGITQAASIVSLFHRDRHRDFPLLPWRHASWGPLRNLTRGRCQHRGLYMLAIYFARWSTESFSQGTPRTTSIPQGAFEPHGLSLIKL